MCVKDISIEWTAEMLDRDAAIAVQREAARRGRKKKKRTASSTSLASNTFQVLQKSKS